MVLEISSHFLHPKYFPPAKGNLVISRLWVVPNPHAPAARPTSRPLRRRARITRNERRRTAAMAPPVRIRTAAVPDASVFRSQHSPHLSLPPAPADALARRRTGGLPRHRLRTSTSPCLTGRRAWAARPADTVFLPQAPIPIGLCSSRRESSNHGFLLISPVLFRVSSIINKNLADVVFLESFTSY
jgi:hypothetical protein